MALWDFLFLELFKKTNQLNLYEYRSLFTVFAWALINFTDFILNLITHLMDET